MLKWDLSTVAYFMGQPSSICSNYQGDKFQTGSSSISFPSLAIELLTSGWHALRFLRFRMDSTCFQHLCCSKQFILSERQTGYILSKWCHWKDDAVKVLHSICQQIWKTQQWPRDWKRSVFIPISQKANTKECSNYCTIVLISHASKVMLKILQVRLQQYVKLWTSRCSSWF